MTRLRSPSPTVSVCIPTYNGAAYLRQCLDSALAQTFDDLEILVVDDCSSDETPAIAREYARYDMRVQLHLNPRNHGLVENWNRCVELARGRWIKFLFQDDHLDPDCLSRMAAAARPGVSLVVARRTFAFEPGTPAAIRRMYEHHTSVTLPRFFGGRRCIPGDVFADHLVEYPTLNCIGEPTAVLIERWAFQRFGRFNPDLLVLGDWEYVARLAIHTGLCYLDEPLATFRVHPNSATQTRLDRQRFWVTVLDSLIMEHELAYAPVYEPARAAARRRRRPVDLTYRLVDSVREARRAMRRYASDRVRPDPRARTEWTEVVKRYPRLEKVPPGYLSARVLTRLRHARWRLVAGVERAIARVTSRRSIEDPSDAP